MSGGWLGQWLWNLLRPWHQAVLFGVVLLGFGIWTFVAADPDPGYGICGWTCTRWIFLPSATTAFLAAYGLKWWEEHRPRRGVFGRARFEDDRRATEKAGLK